MTRAVNVTCDIDRSKKRLKIERDQETPMYNPGILLYTNDWDFKPTGEQSV